MDFNGNIDTSTALVDAVSQQSVRSAYSTDGTNFWVTGNGGSNVTVNSVPNILTSGIHYAQFGVNTGGNTLSTQLNTTGLTANNISSRRRRQLVRSNSGNTSSPLAHHEVSISMSGGVATTTGTDACSRCLVSPRRPARRRMISGSTIPTRSTSPISGANGQRRHPEVGV